MSQLNYNQILDSDSYKLSHFQGYPDDISQVYSYAEARGGRYPSTMVFGVQSFVRHLVEHPVTQENIEEAEPFALAHGLPFNRKGWQSIVDRFDGYLPITIKSAPEGLIVPTRNVLATVSCDPGFKWLTSYIETPFLRNFWPSTTIATHIFFDMKKPLVPLFKEAGETGKVHDFAILDFSSRGTFGYNHAELGGAAYLTMFKGSDNMPAVRFANHNYDSPMSGFSVPATEHSVMCSWMNDGVETVKALIQRMSVRGGTLSIVGDTWSIYNFLDTLVGLKEYILNSGVTIVIRPDSGNIRDVSRQLLPEIAKNFAGERNSKGYYNLNGVRYLWGDGIKSKTVTFPFQAAMDRQISPDMVMAGCGGGLMTDNMDRDTCEFAFKASAIRHYGEEEWVGISKNPITSSSKRSKEGRLSLVRDSNHGFLTLASESPVDVLETRYINGKLFNQVDIEAVRALVDQQLYKEVML